MPPDAPAEPWLSLLNDLDRGLDCVTGLLATVVIARWEGVDLSKPPELIES